MKNILKFIDTWGTRIIFFLVLIIFLKTCTTNNKVERLDKTLSGKIQKVDSIVIEIESNPWKVGRVHRVNKPGAGTHKDRRTKRNRTRSNQNRNAIKEWS